MQGCRQSRRCWQSFSWMVTGLQEPKPRDNGLHPCSISDVPEGCYCWQRDGLHDGTVLSGGAVSGLERPISRQKNSLCTENIFKRKTWMWGIHCNQLPQAVLDLASPLLCQRWSCCWPLPAHGAPHRQDFCLFFFSFLGQIIIICPLRENTVPTKTTTALRDITGQRSDVNLVLSHLSPNC